MDRSGLKGDWDFDFRFTPWSANVPRARGDGITIFDALEKTTGAEQPSAFAVREISSSDMKRFVRSRNLRQIHAARFENGVRPIDAPHGKHEVAPALHHKCDAWPADAAPKDASIFSGSETRTGTRRSRLATAL
jgi:hypothetical protein